MILNYPYPYKAWFTIANDPDNTLMKDWIELDEFIWKELSIPIANSIFIQSYNENLPNQVNLKDNSEIASQPTDIIHTWGDYMHSRKHGFDREDAIESIELLQKHKLNPKVWIDHSQFAGNLLHGSSLGATPYVEDQSGHKYKEFKYTLDLIKSIDIHYVWDGKISETIGLDTEKDPIQFLKENSTKLVYLVKGFLGKFLSNSLLNIAPPKLKQYYPITFPDGNTCYGFTRYGNWKDADIYGLGNIISPEKIDNLISNEGTMIAYTHLGKRPIEYLNENSHIPNNTKAALSNIKEQYDKKELNISPLSHMLDYLVLRDHIQWNGQDGIEFLPDGIRYKVITQDCLKGKVFSFEHGNLDLDNFRIHSGNEELSYTLRKENNLITSIVFN